MNEPVWFNVELIERIHDRQLAEHDRSGGVRDCGMLESAAARAQQTFAYSGPGTDLAGLTASYAFGLARNHPFVDGNKRTAALACELLLELNGYVLIAVDENRYPVFVSLAAVDLDEDQPAKWFAATVAPNKLARRQASTPESAPVSLYRAATENRTMRRAA